MSQSSKWLEWIDEIYMDAFSRPLPIDSYVEAPTGTECQHSFKMYIGFTQTFEYCIYCDEKREVVK